MWAADQRQQRFFHPRRWHKRRTGHHWKTDDCCPSPQRVTIARFHEDCPLSAPTPTVENSSASYPLMLTLALAASAACHFIISFIPSAPRWLYFTAHWLLCRDTHSHCREINVWAQHSDSFVFSLMWRTRRKSKFWPVASVVFIDLSPLVPFRHLSPGGGRRRPFCPMDGRRKQWSFFIFLH